MGLVGELRRGSSLSGDCPPGRLLVVSDCSPWSLSKPKDCRRLRRQLLKGWPVKYSKVAAVVAGSVVAVGMAAPAFADSGSVVDSSFAKDMSTMPTSINGGVEQALAQQPLQKAVDNTKIGDTLANVTGTAQQLRESTSADALLGQAAD